MDQLTAEQQEALRKNATEWLHIMAARTGDAEDDDLETMDMQNEPARCSG